MKAFRTIIVFLLLFCTVAGVASGDVFINGVLSEEAQVVTVAKSGGDYLTIGDAITYAVAQTPSASNLYTIAIYPGVYTEAVTMAAFVNVKGVGTRNSVVIYQSDATVVTLATNSTIENLTVRLGATGDLSSIIDNGVACVATIKDVILESTYTGGGAWNPIHISGDGTYTIDGVYMRKTELLGGEGDDCFLYVDHCTATIYVTNCDIDMRGTAPDEGEAMNMMFLIVGTDVATIHSSNNRFDGDGDAALCYFEAGGRMISNNDANFLTYPNQLLGGSTLTVTDHDFAGIYTLDASTATTIALADAYEKIVTFTADMEEQTSNGAHGTDNITIGATGTYSIDYQLDFESAAAAKFFGFSVFEITAVAAGTAITGISEATPGVVTTSANHGLTNGDRVKITGVVGMVEVNDNVYTIANKADKTFELTDDEGVDIATGGYTSWSSGGTVHLATQIEAGYSRAGFTNQDIPRTASAVCYATLTAGNTLEMYVKDITDDTDGTLSAGQFKMQRIK